MINFIDYWTVSNDFMGWVCGLKVSYVAQTRVMKITETFVHLIDLCGIFTRTDVNHFWTDIQEEISPKIMYYVSR